MNIIQEIALTGIGCCGKCGVKVESLVRFCELCQSQLEDMTFRERDDNRVERQRFAREVSEFNSR